MTIVRFEDIEAWQIGRELTRAVYRISRRGEFARDFALRDQIRRAAVSVTSNIAEGFERGGNREFIQALSVAKGSAGEVRSQLYVALDEEYISQPEFDDLCALALRVSRLIAGFMSFLQKSEIRGPKFQEEQRLLRAPNQKLETRNQKP
jgi:four helix bundle protein